MSALGDWKTGLGNFFKGFVALFKGNSELAGLYFLAGLENMFDGAGHFAQAMINLMIKFGRLSSEAWLLPFRLVAKIIDKLTGSTFNNQITKVLDKIEDVGVGLTSKLDFDSGRDLFGAQAKIDELLAAKTVSDGNEATTTSQTTTTSNVVNINEIIMKTDGENVMDDIFDSINRESGPQPGGFI